MPLHALIVEDNADIATIFTMSLSSTGFEVTHMMDGSAAIHYMMQHTPDIIVLDLMMPGLDGEEVLTWIRANPKLADTKVIIASADARRAMELDDIADMVLMKPVTPQQLIRFAQHLANQKAQVH